MIITNYYAKEIISFIDILNPELLDRSFVCQKKIKVIIEKLHDIKFSSNVYVYRCYIKKRFLLLFFLKNYNNITHKISYSFIIISFPIFKL